MTKRLMRQVMMSAFVGLLFALTVIPPYLSMHVEASHLTQPLSTSQAKLPTPPWWNGNCDSKNDPGSYPLGTSFRGVEACGPLNRSHLVHFFSGAWGEYEWQCTELVMRYLYLAYKVDPYNANGKQVVKNFPLAKYPGLMQEVQNDGNSPLPQPGDILSYNDNYPPNQKYGHTSIVTDVSVNKKGQTIITVIDQNGNSSGGETLQVKNGFIQPWSDHGYTMPITGWLHVLASNPTPTPTPTLSPTPTPPPSFVDAQLNGVATVSANDIWAVGYYINSTGSSYTLIEQWNGASWNVIPSPNPGILSNVFNSVVAFSASDIWAVGYYSDSIGYTDTLTEQWNGTTWNVVPSSNAGEGLNQLNSVTAVSSNDIWAVGYDGVLNGNTYILTEQWNGSVWNVVPSSDSGNYLNQLNGVTAVSATDIWAVGYYTDSNKYTYTLIEQWNGSLWNVIPSPDPNVYGNQLNGVTVVSANNIWAVGYGSNSSGYPSLIEQWNGTTWNVVPSPDPNVYGNQLNSVTVVSADNIWAVGYDDNPSNQTFIEQWNGSVWNIVPSPNPNEYNNQLNGVTAISANDVWAVGFNSYFSGGNDNNFQTLVEQWNGTTWNLVPSP
ncbi:MAG: CHAP domain-containing protein [Ktedonobacteraceae bacterium]